MHAILRVYSNIRKMFDTVVTQNNKSPWCHEWKKIIRNFWNTPAYYPLSHINDRFYHKFNQWNSLFKKEVVGIPKIFNNYSAYITLDNYYKVMTSLHDGEQSLEHSH